MASYIISSINFSSVPSGTQTFTVEYKLASASSYTTASAAVVVNTNGTLVSPLTITGLTSGLAYNIRVSNNCGSPIEYFITNITAP